MKIKLNDEQLKKIKNELSNISNWYTDCCDCGDWIVYLEGLGYFTLSTYCRKSMSCPSGKLWEIDDIAYIYDKNVQLEEFDWDNIKIEHIIDEGQVGELREIANDTIREMREYDEYGNDI